MPGIPKNIRRLARKATIRTRVALLATLLAVTALSGLAYSHLTTTSKTVSRVADEQALTMTTQLAEATAGAGEGVVDVIPFTDRGLDGVVIFDKDGRVVAAGGDLSPKLRGLASDAHSVSHRGRTLQTFRVPSGGSEHTAEALSPWTPDDSYQVTIVPQETGSIAAGYRVDWATERLRSTALSTAVSLAGGAGFICFGLMLMLGRLVTRPLGRLASEVRHMGEGNLEASMSAQSSPELEQLAMDISQMRDDLTHAMNQSSTDPLTGVANHRAFHERLEAEVEAAQRENKPLALIAMDLDNLKLINDRCGHMAGDRVLQAVAGAMTAACREEDVCARVGGDEFAVLCPGASRPVAIALSERIQHAIAALPVGDLLGREHADDFVVSVSVGTSDMPGSARTMDDLLHSADAALYETKGAGRTASSGAAPAGNAGAPAAATVRALAVAVDAKDSGTRSHCETVAEYSVTIARKLGFDPGRTEAVRRAALLHDVGKIGTPDGILHKPAKLSAAEFELMKSHSSLGYRIALAGGLPADEAHWILHHHEHVDGSGYPHGLRGEEIPLESRVLLVADAFEAMTSDRPYRAARSTTEALAELRRCSGRQFDARVVDAFIAAVGDADGGPLDLGAELRATHEKELGRP